MFGNGSPGALWSGGPTPGQSYNVPGGKYMPCNGSSERTLNPIVMGSSILGVHYNGVAVIAADMLGSYGSLSKYRDCPRLLKVNDTTVIRASGDYADFHCFGAYLAPPIILDAMEKKPGMTKGEAVQLIDRCMKLLFYRDARAFKKYQLAVITKE
ncbi:proteasome subunit beta type-4-like [Physella acuta]|uniref:proteasome subunit beta type-4-like n=1 Tax=Physella acuta TaxID=109671 RepID=UPI0027DC172F|nr:proteasome subunit beta type-4-like [Physella acuta]